MRDYDRLKFVWLPLVMYFQAPNQSFDAVHTDPFGFRLSTGPAGESIGLDAALTGDINIVVGNSTSFGVGVSGDSHTMASQLSKYSGAPWLNFSGRSFGMAQELALLNTFVGDFRKLNRIVLFTGANDLVLHHRSTRYPRYFGSFFYWRTFFDAMSATELSPKRRWLKRLLQPFYGERIAYRDIPMSRLPNALIHPPARSSAAPWPGGESARDEDEVAAHVLRLLATWKILARGLGADLTFVLQPLARWVRKAPSPEEVRLFAELDAKKERFHRVLGDMIDRATYDRYAQALRAGCARMEIPFFDANAHFETGHDGQWVFADRIHLTDQGTQSLASALAGIV